MNSVHENGLLTRARAARPPKRISTAILVTIAVGLVLCSALPSWFLMRSAKFTANIRSGDFGYYNNERVMLTEYSAQNRIMDIPDVRSDFKFTRPDGKEVTLQVPRGIRYAKATWAAEPGVVVGTISALSFTEIAHMPREKGEMTIVLACRAVCWDELGEMHLLESFLQKGLLSKTRLLFVYAVDRTGISVGGTFPFAENVQAPSEQVYDEAKLREIGLSNAQVILRPKGYSLMLRRN